MDWKNLLGNKPKKEQLQDLQDDLEIEKVKAEIRELKNKGRKEGHRWNPDPKHLGFLKMEEVK